MRLAIAGGGTGGHLLVGIALAQELRRRGGEVLFLSTDREFDRAALTRQGFRFVPVARRSLRGLAEGAARAAGLLRAFRPQALLALGGYGALPGVAAARLLGVPISLHEQNWLPGRANRAALPIARRAFTQWPLGGRWTHTGTPLRDGLARIDRAEARRRFGLDPAAPTLLVLGGSQGARALNEAVPAAGRPPWQVLHLAGKTGARYADVRAVVLEFTEEMGAAYSAADLVVARAGGLTTWELAAFGLPAILVPLPGSRDGHQDMNARRLAALGAAVHLPERRLARELPVLLAKEDGWPGIGARLHGLYRADAAEAILGQTAGGASRTWPGGCTPRAPCSRLARDPGRDDGIALLAGPSPDGVARRT